MTVRALVLFLVFANLALWAYMDFAAQRSNSGALAQQVHPERLRLLKNIEDSVASTVNGTACVEFGPLSEAALTRARETARTLQADIDMAERRGEAGIYLELRNSSEVVRKQVGDVLTGVVSGACAG